MKQQKTDPSLQSNLNSKFDGLNTIQFWAYGVGHFLNDLTAACWFNYLLFFLTTVVKTSAAPFALLVGQVCDGFATPIVGYLSDCYETRFGKRTPWYAFGLLTIFICFIPIFSSFRHENLTYEYLYYSIFPGLFNVGWACLQISHMSLVPSLTCSRKRRDRLNNYRNSFSFLANLIVLLLGLVIFSLMRNKQLEYELISYLVVGIGVITSLFFLFYVKEKELVVICSAKKAKFKEKLAHKKVTQDIQQAMENHQTIQSERYMKKVSISQLTVDDNGKTQDAIILQEKKETIKLSHWFKKPKFYLFGICYMCVRLNSNVFGTFVPFYLIYVLKLSPSHLQENTIPFSVALVPLIIYFSSSLVSARIGWFYGKIGRRGTLLLGTLLSMVSLSPLFILQKQNANLIYLLSIAIGASQSMILGTGINFISDVIGSKSESGAIVFGIYSFLDKIVAGLIIYFIANLSCFQLNSILLQEDRNLIKKTVIVIPMGAAIAAAITVLLSSVKQYREKGENGLSQSKMENQEFVHSVTLQ